MREVSGWRVNVGCLGLGELVNMLLNGAPWRPIKWGTEFAREGPVVLVEHALGILVMYFAGALAMLVVMFVSSWVRREL